MPESLASFFSHLYFTACLRCDVMEARCVFDWLCLCGPDGFVTAELVVLPLQAFASNEVIGQYWHKSLQVKGWINFGII